MKRFVGTVIVAALAAAAYAQPYNARGGFNGWAEAAMTDDGDGTFSLFVDGFVAADLHEFKVAQNDWASNWPGTNVKAAFDGGGGFTFHFRPGSIADGWLPASNRVGYTDPEQFGWEVTGEFNSWNDGIDTAARQMTNLGNGLYSVDYTIATVGSHPFKFRKSNSWDVAIGSDFGNTGGNAVVTTANPNTLVTFQLDLPNGRWKSSGPQINGMDIPNKYGGDALILSQVNQTNLGNDITPCQQPGQDPACDGGNEMDRLFLDNNSANLHLSITGNLDYTGNPNIIFLDTIPGKGQTVLKTDPGFDDGPPYNVGGLHNSTFDSCFRPDFALACNNFGGAVYATLYVLEEGVVPTNANGKKVYLGNNSVGSGSGGLGGGSGDYSIQVAYDNSNILGVNAVGDPVGNPTTATNGLETLIPLDEIGNPPAGRDIKIFALLSTGAGEGTFGNQAIPGIPNAFYGPNSGDPETRPGFDFGGAAFPGLQFASYTISAAGPCNPADTNCDGSVNLFDIDPFVGILSNTTTPCSPCAGDVNSDGSINLFDIDPFVGVLSGC